MSKKVKTYTFQTIKTCYIDVVASVEATSQDKAWEVLKNGGDEIWEECADGWISSNGINFDEVICHGES
tara:strand:- start:213 stop:419 length:207 start_codon:yes stop_codon:yes gene_type:complete